MLPIFVFIGLLLTSPLPSLAARSSSVTPIPKRADSSIIDLTDANFASLLPPTNSENEYLIEFYANWCGYCRSFAPEYDNLADKVKSELPHVKLARVDIDSSPIVTARFFVSRLPSLYHVKGTQVRSVTIPGRTVSELFEFLAEEKWKDLAVWSEWTGPFSLLSQVVGLAGGFGFALSKYLESLTSFVPLPVLLGILSVVLFAVFYVTIKDNVAEKGKIGSRRTAETRSARRETQRLKKE